MTTCNLQKFSLQWEFPLKYREFYFYVCRQIIFSFTVPSQLGSKRITLAFRIRSLRLVGKLYASKPFHSSEALSYMIIFLSGKSFFMEWLIYVSSKKLIEWNQSLAKFPRNLKDLSVYLWTHLSNKIFHLHKNANYSGKQLKHFENVNSFPYFRC